MNPDPYKIFSDVLGENKSLVTRKHEIDSLIDQEYDINTVYETDRTLIIECIDCMYYGLRAKNYDTYNDYFEVFKYLVAQGANTRLGNMMKYMANNSYKDQMNVNFVGYLIDKNLIDTHNRIIYGKKYLYDTKLGKCILQLLA